MSLSLIYVNPRTHGKIYQCGWRDIPIQPKPKQIDVIVLAAEELPTPPGYSKAYETTVIRVPLYDDFEPDQQELLDIWDKASTAATQVAELNRQGRNVIVSCHLGKNRSGLITALALRIITKADPRIIINHIRKRRPIGVLENPAFVQLIVQTSNLLV